MPNDVVINFYYLRMLYRDCDANALIVGQALILIEYS
jgi:hypothetical protein